MTNAVKKFSKLTKSMVLLFALVAGGEAADVSHDLERHHRVRHTKSAARHN